jgi:hypothetical protein
MGKAITLVSLAGAFLALLRWYSELPQLVVVTTFSAEQTMSVAVRVDCQGVDERPCLSGQTWSLIMPGFEKPTVSHAQGLPPSGSADGWVRPEPPAPGGSPHQDYRVSPDIKFHTGHQIMLTAPLKANISRTSVRLLGAGDADLLASHFACHPPPQDTSGSFQVSCSEKPEQGIKERLLRLF